MSNDILDDPMDTGAPRSDLSGDSSSVGVPQLPRNDDERDVAPVEMSKTPVAPVRVEDKRDRETYDEAYDLTVNEPAVDVEAISCLYSGRAFLIRGRFIAKHCPKLRADAYCALINYLKENTSDVSHYMIFFNELEHTLSHEKLSVSFPLPVRDTKWIDEVNSIWQLTLDRLQTDYKKNKDEGVKESTRRAMEDLFAHFVAAGKVEDAIKLYSRGIRDYCTQLKHNINMWLNWIEVSIWANDWSRLESVVNTAYRSLKDADDAERNSQNQPPRGDNATFLIERDAPPNAAPALTNRMLIETALAKCLAARALSKLHNGKYFHVVDDVMEIKTENLQAKWFATTSDLGIYALLCAMATMERGTLKTYIGGSGAFRKLLESEPLFIELLSSYTSSRFGRCFEIMYSVKKRLLLDPFISRNVNELFNMIRQKCVVQYILPYSTVKMDTMCAALGTTMTELQKSLIELMESKSIAMQIDQNAGVIRILDEKEEGTILRRVDQTCDRAILRAKSLLWKTTLASANIHAIPDKEPRQKRKQQKDFGKEYNPYSDLFGRNDRAGADADDDVMIVGDGRRASRAEGSSSNAQMSDDFNIVFEQQQPAHYVEDLGDI